MDAIKLLKEQHREVEALWKKFESSEEDDVKETLFNDIADALAIHAAIEEKFFYPAVRARQTEEELEEAYDEHLEVKKLILDAMNGTEKPGFDGMVAALMGAVKHHVEEEEEELFPKVKEIMEPEALEALGQAMEGEASIMEEAGNARLMVQVKTEEPVVQA
ncbi:MAG: Hemerythrin cation binding domain protein [Myxococcales bacterium]|nr:Hemerythrin cation binding domain protein [Myxococcales bacterium]